ncbi:MAG: SGNH/GDSL hydrolase family protein [Pirellulales bacterium]|nr:SGNH/GDSL hydrolase family protein [Pirellulales bacterium]
MGDSYTDALQVEYDDTFCAGVQSYLRRAFASKDLRTENYGVSGTGLFAYWHRILHDVLDSEPPNALVLCINPGNDFTDFCPDDGFAADGTPLRDYFTAATLRNHVNTWAVQHSALALYVYRKYKIYRASKPLQSTEGNGRTEPWWTRAEMAESVLGTRKVRNALSLVRAIVAECRQRDVQCAILILGNTSYATDGSQSPITEIFRKAGIQCPILDVCHHMDSSAKQYAFPMDGHLNREGHRFVTSHAAPFLAGKLDFSPLCPQPPFP